MSAEEEDLARQIQVSWDREDRTIYNAEIQIKAIDRKGLFADLALRINEKNIGLISMNARANKDKIVLVNATLEINGIEQLNDLMQKMRKIKNVLDVYRVTS